MSTTINLSDIEGKRVMPNKFHDFVVTETLIEYDFPQLLVAKSPDKTKWLFNWCDTITDPFTAERWVAFKVSDSRLHALKKGNISLREVVTLAEGIFYIFDAHNLFTPIEIRKSSPERIPKDYLPLDDISVNGIALNPTIQNDDQLIVRLHMFSKKLSEGEGPLNIIGPLQDSFQHYMTWAAHTINKTAKGRASATSKNWSAFNLKSVAAGSFKMECVSNNRTPEQIEKLSQACDLLEKLSNGTSDDIKNVMKKFGNDVTDFARILAELISNFDLSMSISWVSVNTPSGYLAIDKRRADKLLRDLKSVDELEYPRTVTITLTTSEIEPIRKPIRGQGGMQNLLRGLQQKITEENTITLTPMEIGRILRYGMNYGQGGFQDRLVGVARALKRIGVSFHNS